MIPSFPDPDEPNNGADEPGASEDGARSNNGAAENAAPSGGESNFERTGGGAPPPQAGDNGDLVQRKQKALWTLIGVSLVLGVIDVGLGGSLSESARFTLALVGNVALLVIAFHWLNLDSRQLGIRRPTWLNIGIVLLLIVFVPYYLYKTRPAGQRGSVLLGFVAVLFACVFASAIGSALAAVVTGTPIAPAG